MKLDVPIPSAQITYVPSRYGTYEMSRLRCVDDRHYDHDQPREGLSPTSLEASISDTSPDPEHEYPANCVSFELLKVVTWASSAAADFDGQPIYGIG